MQKRKNILLMVSLTSLLVITALLYWSGNERGSLKIDKEIFRVEDLQSISKVVLESPGRRVDLAYNGSRWKVNDRADADRTMIDVLFATLRQAEPKRPVAEIQADSIGNELVQKGTKVTLYAGETPMLEFYAGGNRQKTQAYFRRAEEVPFVMVIPGYRVYTSGIFELPESGWKDKYVFGFNWRNFQELQASFPSSPRNNFNIAMGKDFFGIEGMPRIDTAKLNTFLDQVSLLTVDQYLEPGAIADSLAKIQPVMIIGVTDIAKRNYSLKIFSAPEKNAGVLGLIGDSQPAVFDPGKIGPLLRQRQFFEGQ